MLALALISLGQATVTSDMLPSPKDMLHGKEIQKPVPVTAYAVSQGSNHPPSAGSISPDKKSPQMAGETISWTGLAADPDGDELLYQFWLNGPSTGNNWKAMTNWSRSNTWDWTTHPIDSGNNIIDMRVRDGYHAGLGGWDSHLSAEYFINGEDFQTFNNKPRLLNLKSDRQSPQDQGAKVTWTTMALDDDGDTIFYQYWLKGPSTEEQWMPVTLWTTNNVWTWNTAQADGGIYSVEVRVRDGYHEGTESSDDSKRVAYIVRLSGIIK